MLISDHLNLTGTTPLLGGPNFKDMSEVYTKRLRPALHGIAKAEGLELFEGVYAGLLGPQYETPAEIRMLRTIGADAVGMSTVLEAIQARRRWGWKSWASQRSPTGAAGITSEELSHGEVMDIGKSVGGEMTKLLGGLVGTLARD